MCVQLLLAAQSQHVLRARLEHDLGHKQRAYESQAVIWLEPGRHSIRHREKSFTGCGVVRRRAAAHPGGAHSHVQALQRGIPSFF